MIYKGMKNLKLFEDFTEELFNLPVFVEWTDEEDEKFSDLVYPVLEPFEGDYFELDEPSRGYGKWEESNDLRADYWLTKDSMNKLGILTHPELKKMQEIFPDNHREYKRKDWQGKEVTGYSVIQPIFGNFYWYAIPEERNGKPYWGRKKEKIWLIAKDAYGKYRVAHGEVSELRSLWNSAKPWENLEDLVKSEIPTLKEIAQYFNDHLEDEKDAWDREAESNSRDDDDYRATIDYNWYNR